MHEGRELPSFSLREIDLPEVMTWEINNRYYLVMRVEMVGKHNRSDLQQEHDKGKVEGVFKIESVRPVDKEPVDAKMLEKRDFEKTVSDVKSGKV